MRGLIGSDRHLRRSPGFFPSGPFSSILSHDHRIIHFWILLAPSARGPRLVAPPPSLLSALISETVAIVEKNQTHVSLSDNEKSTPSTSTKLPLNRISQVAYIPSVIIIILKDYKVTLN